MTGRCKECGVITTNFIEFPDLYDKMMIVYLCPEHKWKMIKKLQEEKK